MFATFTPFFGLHFFIAFAVARMMRGNIFAALMATFVGNPPTFVLIAATSLRTGHFLLGTEFEKVDDSLGKKFKEAASTLWHNFKAIFTDATAEWRSLEIFYNEVFFPYLVGGLIPGAIAGTIGYMLSVPVIRAYQQRRRSKIKAKFEEIKRKAAEVDVTPGLAKD